MFEQVFGVAPLIQNLDQLPQVLERVGPTGLGGCLRVKAIGLILVAPMGRDALLSHEIHDLGADLHLDARRAWADHGGVD